MSAHICPVVKLGPPQPIPGADKIEVFNVEGSGPVVQAKGQFKEGDLACFIPPETMVDTGIAAFEFLKKNSRKSDGWAKIKPVRLRGQLSVGVLVSAMGKPEGSNLAKEYNVKKIEDLEVKHEHFDGRNKTLWDKAKAWWNKRFSKEAKGLWPGIPVYDINQLYKMPKGIFADDELMIVTEKLHGTNARFVIGKDSKLWVGSRTMWRLHDGKNVYSRAAIESGIEAKLRRLAEPLVLWGEIVGPQIQKGFSYGLKDGEIKFYAFDIYHATERRFLDPRETQDICRWLDIDMVPVLYIATWDNVRSNELNKFYDTMIGVGDDHPSEGKVIRPYKGVKETHALDGSRCLVAGKVINPAYLECREKPGMDEQIFL